MPSVDEALFRRAREGDRQAFWELVLPFRELIYSVALGMLKNHEQAEDQLHEVLLQAFRSLSNLRDPARLGSWLYSMTRNLSLDQIRKAQRLRGAIYASHGHGTSVAPVVPVEQRKEKEQWLTWMKAALDQLPEPFRVALALNYMNDTSCQEMAEILELTVPAVKSRLFQARKLLRRKTETLAAKEKGLDHGLR